MLAHFQFADTNLYWLCLLQNPLAFQQQHDALDLVSQVVREADGYQSHLVSPEFGLRRLVDETIGMVLEPVNMCVRRVHQVLIDAARYGNTYQNALSHHVS